LSKNKGFSITSAERYSLALYELASENNVLAQVEDQSLSILNLISSSKDFSNLIKDPTNNKDDLLKVISSISDNNKFETLQKRGELKAELKSAKELSSDEISKITDELTKNFSSKIKLNYKHDESLIGGLVVQVGSTMVDTSIKNKLQQIENRMIEA
jgi:F-type H+-transporting ATPase subunit delta